MKIKEGGGMDIQDKAFKGWFAQYENNIEYASEEIAWDAWQAAKAQAVPEGFVLVPKKPDKDTIIEMAAVCLMPRRKIDDIEFLSISEAKEVYQAMIKAQEPAND